MAALYPFFSSNKKTLDLEPELSTIFDINDVYKYLDMYLNVEVLFTDLPLNLHCTDFKEAFR